MTTQGLTGFRYKEKDSLAYNHADSHPDTLGLNVLAYLAGSKEDPDTFFRKRFELPLTAGAEAEPGDAQNSNWGVDKKLLQIGQKAAPFALPNAKGELVSSDGYLGKQNLIVSTYRAHW